MKFPRRKFLYLAASAVTLPAASRIASAQGVSGTHVSSMRHRGNAPAMRDLAAGRSDWLPMIKAANIKGK
jgi:hypothetical protein